MLVVIELRLKTIGLKPVWDNNRSINMFCLMGAGGWENDVARQPRIPMSYPLVQPASAFDVTHITFCSSELTQIQRIPSGSIAWSLKSLANKPSILPWLKKGMPTRCRGSYGIQIKSLLLADEKSQTRLCRRCGQLRKSHFVVALVPANSSPVSHSFFGRSACCHYPGHVRL